MPLPRWLARSNRRFTNHILGRIPRRISPFVFVTHIGRVSGRRYSTPLAAFVTKSGYVLTPTYGLEADWVRNILAMPDFEMDRRGRRIALHNPRVVPRAEAWPHLPLLVRGAMRVMRIEWFIAADNA